LVEEGKWLSGQDVTISDHPRLAWPWVTLTNLETGKALGAKVMAVH
jgi:hypothetical protein